jgi:hypothetical protein
MAHATRFRAVGLLLFAVACGGSPEAEPKTATEARPSAEKPAPALPELDVMKVARALRGNEAQLRECFASDSGPVRGFMRMTFQVEGSGAVSNVEVETSSFAEPTVATCLSEKIADLHFDAPGEKTQTHWTFVSGLYEKSDDEAKDKKRKKKKEKKREDSSEQGVVIDEKSEGSLHPEEIEDIVHAGFGLFAHCYREGLERYPRLAGTVRLRMVIGRDGLVDHLRDADSEIPDPELIDCVAEGFFALRFPRPRSGTVRLVYRIVFDNG